MAGISTQSLSPKSGYGIPGGVALAPMSEWVSSDADTSPSEDSNEEELQISQGQAEIEALQERDVLTSLELVRRRKARIQRLLSLYKKQHWMLLESLRQKHRKYYVRRGRTGLKSSGTSLGEAAGADAASPKLEDSVSCTLSACQAEACVSRAMPLTSYCFRHILQQPGQCLYKPNKKGKPTRCVADLPAPNEAPKEMAVKDDAIEKPSVNEELPVKIEPDVPQTNSQLVEDSKEQAPDVVSMNVDADQSQPFQQT
mmetsp:Transcript_24569/g.46605  ORF Transcript_24569/g.46605 Transcript_24569/m.46605 type:complete len:256 (+) Transcript_24569:73-840(+)|eukprot:CAMPEP_0114225828 /NCGR_PEP_ID=MMETSP0058-20121206/891_1 /TAXON_ID=36894 /ORGANISM="Pyramimonas parkeae, CCMP726" /LENGTH=255 /DNA_ID=CAMNT_0001336481 /DNA_START=18 /DNA_END=785 /DNA_ORIENTATION=+